MGSARVGTSIVESKSRKPVSSLLLFALISGFVFASCHRCVTCFFIEIVIVVVIVVVVAAALSCTGS